RFGTVGVARWGSSAPSACRDPAGGGPNLGGFRVVRLGRCGPNLGGFRVVRLGRGGRGLGGFRAVRRGRGGFGRRLLGGSAFRVVRRSVRLGAVGLRLPRILGGPVGRRRLPLAALFDDLALPFGQRLLAGGDGVRA